MPTGIYDRRKAKPNKGGFKKGHPYFGNSREVHISKESLEIIYIGQKLSAEKCASLFDCSQGVILNKLRKYGIPIRTIGEANKGKRRSPDTEFKKGEYTGYGRKTRFKNGKDHPFWKGGISSLYDKIKQTLQYRIWRDLVYKRDYWHCQICNKHCERGDIVAHHKRSFADYPELRFDVDNGITLCRGCHLKIHRGEEEINGNGAEDRNDLTAASVNA